MKTAELRSKSQDELSKMLLDMSKEQFNFRIQKSTGQLESAAKIRGTRRDIAKIKTILNEMKSGKAPAAKKAAKAPAKKKTKE